MLPMLSKTRRLSRERDMQAMREDVDRDETGALHRLPRDVRRHMDRR